MLLLLLLLLPLAEAGNPARMAWSRTRLRPTPKPRQSIEPVRAPTPGPPPGPPEAPWWEALPGYPDTLAIRLPAALVTVQGSRAGVFTKTNATRHHRPVWRQEPGDQFLFFAPSGHWMVGSNTSLAWGGLASLERGLDLVPATGWRYWTADGWRPGPAILVTEPEEPDILRVAGREGDRAGVYTRAAGRVHGRPVWRHTSDAGQAGNLSIHFNCNGFWYVYYDEEARNEREGFLASEKPDLIGPQGTRWDFWQAARAEVVLSGDQSEEHPARLVLSTGVSSPHPDISSPHPGIAGRLGTYYRTNKTRNGRPEWSQEGGGRNSLYFDCNGHWFVWPEDTKDLAGLQLRAQGRLGLPWGRHVWLHWTGALDTHTRLTEVRVVEGTCSAAVSPCGPGQRCRELWGGVTCQEDHQPPNFT